jgi:hypothetical protein
MGSTGGIYHGAFAANFKIRSRVGATGFEPLELLEKLAALVPAPRVNLIRSWPAGTGSEVAGFDRAGVHARCRHGSQLYL